MTSHLEIFIALWYGEENLIQAKNYGSSAAINKQANKQGLFLCVDKMSNVFINESNFQENKHKIIKCVYVEGENIIDACRRIDFVK